MPEWSYAHPTEIMERQLIIERQLFFLSSPWQPKLRRISARKSNKNKTLASENNLPQSCLLVLLNRL